jgi:hypothetical protein
MAHSNEEQKQQYLYRSYCAVDGLWFMKAEEAYGFDKALEIDRAVWEIMPKIQSRFLKSAYGVDRGIEALRICFTEKLLLDGFIFETEIDEDGKGFIIKIKRCPWYDLMVKSNRSALAHRVGNCICSAECTAWTREFGEDISMETHDQICGGSEICILQFRQT